MERICIPPSAPTLLSQGPRATGVVRPHARLCSVRQTSSPTGSSSALPSVRDGMESTSGGLGSFRASRVDSSPWTDSSRTLQREGIRVGRSVELSMVGRYRVSDSGARRPLFATHESRSEVPQKLKHWHATTGQVSPLAAMAAETDNRSTLQQGR